MSIAVTELYKDRTLADGNMEFVHVLPGVVKTKDDDNGDRLQSSCSNEENS